MFWRIATILLGCLVVYWFGIGPILYIGGVKIGDRREELPSWIRIVYYPILNCKAGVISRLTDNYVCWWLLQTNDDVEPQGGCPQANK